MPFVVRALTTAAVCLLLAACDGAGGIVTAPATPAPGSASATAETQPRDEVFATEPGPPEPTASEPRAQKRPRQSAGVERPAWLGTRILPKTAAGYGEVRPTPPILRNRRLATEDVLPQPTNNTFRADVRAVPDDVLARSTWSPQCPVSRKDLRYVTVSFHGFDGLAHTGELLVHTDAAQGMVTVFRRLYRSRFPMEEMRVVARPELTLPPTGDGNNTTSFVCRPSRGSTSWSQHAYGLAIDVNPFHNPYVKGDVVLPELASAYRNRQWRRPGMHHASSTSVRAFAAIGWAWGGNWSDPKDPMHFSSNGR